MTSVRIAEKKVIGKTNFLNPRRIPLSRKTMFRRTMKNIPNFFGKESCFGGDLSAGGAGGEKETKDGENRFVLLEIYRWQAIVVILKRFK